MEEAQEHHHMTKTSSETKKMGNTEPKLQNCSQQ